MFYAAVPSRGDYRLYLDFQHGDVVRTASFALSAAEDSEPTEPTSAPSDSGHSGH